MFSFSLFWCEKKTSEEFTDLKCVSHFLNCVGEDLLIRKCLIAKKKFRIRRERSICQDKVLRKWLLVHLDQIQITFLPNFQLWASGAQAEPPWKVRFWCKPGASEYILLASLPFCAETKSICYKKSIFGEISYTNPHPMFLPSLWNKVLYVDLYSRLSAGTISQMSRHSNRFPVSTDQMEFHRDKPSKL